MIKSMRNTLIRAVLLATIATPLLGCQTGATPQLPPAAASHAQSEVPRNVIFFIADGMGSSHFTVMDRIEGRRSVLPGFSHTGMVQTHSANQMVTDSAASAVAYATGHKVINRQLSVSAVGTPLETVLEIAEERGMATGLMTTSAFWDATLAAFAAHEKSRYDHVPIIRQMLSKDVELVAGNRLEDLGTDGRPEAEELAEEFGYVLVTEPTRLADAPPGNLLAVFPGQHNDMEHPAAPLSRLTEIAIERLSQDPDGFFLVIETEATDTASHNNDTMDVLDALRSLNRAVSVAMRYAESTGDTLILFTGDHETGDLSINDALIGGQLDLKWGTTGHTGQAIPIFAVGPGANLFTGWLDNTEVGVRLRSLVAR